MSKAGKRIVRSIAEARRYARGETTEGFVGRRFADPEPRTIDVRTIRDQLGLSQAAAAQRFGFGLSSVQSWERGGVSRVVVPVCCCA